MIHSINKYLGKKVIVIAGTMTYRGVLKSIEEDSVQLKGLNGWIEIPTAKITTIRGEDEKKGFGDKRFVDPSFYNSSENNSDKS